MLSHKKTRASDPSYPYSYMSWKHTVADNNVPGSFHPTIRQSYMVRSEVLSALGLLLIELCFGETLAEMHALEGGDPNEASTETTTAHRLSISVYNETGTSHGDAVRRCFYQPFDVRHVSFDDKDVLQKVLDDILTPLGDDLANVEGKSRIGSDRRCQLVSWASASFLSDPLSTIAMNCYWALVPQ